MVLMLDIATKNYFENEIYKKKILQNKIASFAPKVKFEIELGDYTLKTAESSDEITQVIELRRHSFMADFTPNANLEFIDFDEYDLLADHILVLNRENRQLLGSYRIISSKFTKQCYSKEQFDLRQFDLSTDSKIELGRACIHKNFRNGIALNLVWKGIAEYAALVSARYLYGCASVKTISQDIAYSLYAHLYPNFYDTQYNISILPKFHFASPIHEAHLYPWKDVEHYLPSLLRSYLQAGAKICSEPALDTFFQCIDFLTVLDLNNIEPKYQRRYFRKD